MFFFRLHGLCGAAVTTKYLNDAYCVPNHKSFLSPLSFALVAYFVHSTHYHSPFSSKLFNMSTLAFPQMDLLIKVLFK